MRYEVSCNGVTVYHSDLECDVRVLADGAEVYALVGTPEFEEAEGGSRIFKGGSTESSYVDAKGKPIKIPAKKWTP